MSGISQQQYTPAVFRVARGGVLPDALTNYVRTNKIAAATCTAIGAIEDVVLAYYDLTDRTYKEQRLEGIWELVSLIGNVATKDGAPYLHAHVVVSDPDMHTRGGHLVSCTVAATVEVTLTPRQDAITRSFDEDTGLFLMNIPTVS
jgi:hypothetical protein